MLDARRVLENPAGTLAALCARIGVPYDPAMLHWAPGPRPTDGVWEPHWYAAVNRSTGFAPYRPCVEELPATLRPLLAQCEEIYAQLVCHSLES